MDLSKQNMVVDVGNSRIKFGLFQQDQLIQTGILDSSETDNLIETAYNHSVKNIIISTTGAEVENLHRKWKDDFRVVLLDHTTPLPLKIDYKTPETLGRDRLAVVAGAHQLFPNNNCIIADAGTCITYELLVNGTYLGGNIAPGLKMRLHSMNAFTARLPLVEAGDMDTLTGKSTETAMRNGAQWGILFELEGYIKHWEAAYGPLVVLATGGDAPFFEKMLKREIFVNPHLVLIGLNKILTYNA
ncbi:MAG: type III pantothenate kinase [Bacteroidetes bacterium]|nr:type III pantothenate kinase [Bacteroidota bacterium]